MGFLTKQNKKFGELLGKCINPLLTFNVQKFKTYISHEKNSKKTDPFD